jgi:UDP-4-amino-4,6-dideoxy-N-acetyl-beta-L-altrosamine N-acetyltransferase
VANDFEFRRMQKNDLGLVLEWRQKSHVEKYMLTQFVGDEATQLQWYDNQVKREDREYWIILVQGRPIGLINLIDVTYPNKETADAGFYIGEPEFSNMAGFILPCFYNYVFNDCGFRKINGNVILGNPIIHLHKMHGYKVIEEVTVASATGYEISCQSVELTSADWKKKKRFSRYTAKFE